MTAAIPTGENDFANSTENPQVAENILKSAKDIIKRLDAQYTEWCYKQNAAGWDYASNLTEENLAKKLNVSVEAARVSKQIAQEINAFPWKDLQDENIRRQFKKLGILGTAALPEDVSTDGRIQIDCFLPSLRVPRVLRKS